MSFKIDVSGLDELEKEIEEMQQGLSLSSLQHWAQEIETTARTLAQRSPSDAIESIGVEVLETEPKTFEVKAHGQERALPFIAEATRIVLHDMPITSQAVFESFLDELEKSIPKPSSSSTEREQSENSFPS